MARSKGYVDTLYLLTTAIRLQALKQRSYDLMHLQRGATVLDLGCGPGVDTVALAALVGPTGTVFGVDYDADMIAAADRRAEEAGVAARVRHLMADVAALPLPVASVDACRCERVFQHLPRPEPAFAEMVRVVRPGGWIVVVDVDYGTLSVDTPEVDLERRLVRFGAEHCLHNGYAGRRLWRIFRQQGLEELSVGVQASYATDYATFRSVARAEVVEREALAAGVVSAEELRRFQASLEDADRAGAFFCSVSTVVVAGRVSAPAAPSPAGGG